MERILNDLDKKIKEANSGMRVASPSVVISLNTAMNIRRVLSKSEYLLAENAEYRVALDKAHILLEHYEILIGEDVIAENNKYREALEEIAYSGPVEDFRDIAKEALREEGK